MLKNLDKYRLIPFVQYAKLWVAVSIIVILVGAGFMVKNQRELGHPFFLGIDFTGGSFIQLKLAQPGDAGTITEIVKKYSVGEPWVQMRSGHPREVEIRVNIDTSEAESEAEASRLRVEKFDQMKADLAALYGGTGATTSPLTTDAASSADETENTATTPDEGAESAEAAGIGGEPTEAKGDAAGADGALPPETASESEAEAAPAEPEPTPIELEEEAAASANGIEQLSFDYVGPVVGGELIRNAIIALILGSIAIMIYIFIRFNRLVFAIAAVVALLHDVLITLSGTAFFRLEINAFFIAVILTIIGYSINDTIIIYDRIRENLKNLPQLNFPTLINLSLTQTLTRSVNTALTTILILVTLLIWGGRSIHDFATAMLIGMISGAYSSIFIAAPVVLWFTRERVAHARIPATIDLPAVQEQAVLGTWEEEEAQEEPAPEPSPPTPEPAPPETATAREEPLRQAQAGAAERKHTVPERRSKKKRKKARRR